MLRPVSNARYFSQLYLAPRWKTRFCVCVCVFFVFCSFNWNPFRALCCKGWRLRGQLQRSQMQLLAAAGCSTIPRFWFVMYPFQIVFCLLGRPTGAATNAPCFTRYRWPLRRCLWQRFTSKRSSLNPNRPKVCSGTLGGEIKRKLTQFFSVQ